MSLKAAIVRQFGRPTGMVGRLAGQIMARRSSNRIRNQKTVSGMMLKPDSRVLEIGCGPGLALALCAEIVTEGRIVGLDHSPVMIEQARRQLLSAGHGQKVELLIGGLDSLDDWPSGFDRVYSLNVIQFIKNKPDFFRRVLMTLDDGGMGFTTYQPRLDNDDPDAAMLMADEIAGIMQVVGFSGVDRFVIQAGPTPALCVYGTKPGQ